MSVDQQSPVTDHEIFATKTQPATSEQGFVDRRLRHLKEDVLPFYPFLLTVPTDLPFRLGNRFVNNWAVGPEGPFAPEEQQLQYMTFLTHQEGDSLLVAVGDWTDGTGNVMADQRSGTQSAASTPAGVSSKRKISLNDYKNKKKSDTLTSSFSETTNRSASTSQLSEDNNNQRSSRTNFPAEGGIQGHSNASLSLKGTIRHTAESPGRKRSPEPEHEYSQPHDEKHSEMRSSKKARLSPEMAENVDSDRSNNSPHGLPVLLSPTLPPTSASPGLPRLLSPTLPADIEKELARLREESPMRDTSQKRSSSNPSMALKSDTAKTKFPSTSKSLQGRSYDVNSQGLRSRPLNAANNGSCSNSDGYDSSERSAIGLHSHAVDKLLRSFSHNTTPITRTPPVNDKLQLVVRLKYGRSNRKRVEALLKFPKKGKTIPRSPSMKGSRHKEAERFQEKTTGPDYLAPVSDWVEGRTRSDKTVAPVTGRSKEVKDSTSPTEPKTPAARSSISTLTQHRHENLKVTPGKDPKILHRLGSGNDGKTPHSKQGSKYTPGDPGEASKSPLRQPEDQAIRSRNHERRAWKDEFLKYSNLGRELKHAADRHTAKDGASAADEKLAAVTAIEAIICFILAFVADDQSKALARQVGESSTWLSILAYWRVVMKNNAPYKQLYHLCLLLGAVSYDSIHVLDLERLATSSFPGDRTPAPTPGSDGTTITDDSKKGRKEFLELKTRLLEFYKESRRLWIEGMQGLSEDVLTREFPVTWSNRSTNYSELGIQRLKVGQYSGSYFLPFGKATAPLEIVRFGWSILNEWCAKEGVNWNGRLGL